VGAAQRRRGGGGRRHADSDRGLGS
jgi:hypothetical protein